MDQQKIDAFLAGADDIEVLEWLCAHHDACSYTLDKPKPGKRVIQFLDAMELWRWLCGSGIEQLFEQGVPFDHWIKVFPAVGFNEARPIFERVRQLVPDEIYLPEYTPDSGAFIHSKFDELKVLLHEFYDLQESLEALLSKVVREEKDVFFPPA